MVKKLLMAAAAMALFAATPALADSSWGPPPGADPDGYYSRADQDGYYDRSGRYHRFEEYRRNDRDMGPPPDADDDRGYDDSAYLERCERGNTAAGTIFGALAGGLIGGAASHGDGGAVVGGAILGGLLGNAVSRDMPCEDHPHAFRAYSRGLNGNIGMRYSWRNGNDYGYFTPTREFHRGRTVCRSWSETTYAGGRNYTRTGTACRRNDGNWRFDD